MQSFAGIILRSTDYKEKDKLLNIATSNGIITVLARGVRSANAKLKAFVSVLTFGEFCVQSGKMGNILTSVNCEESFYNCWTDTDKYAAAMLCVEAYEKCFSVDEDSDFAFVCLLKALKEINYSQTMPCAAALWFLTRVSAIMGIDYRQLEDFDKDTVLFLAAMERLDCAEIDGLETSQNQIFQCLRCLYYLFEKDYGIKLLLISKALCCNKI